MKKISRLIGLCVAGLVIMSCGSTDTGKKDDSPKMETKAKFEFIEHKGSILGKDPPSWVGESAAKIETMDIAKDSYAFPFESEGQDLRGAQLAAEQIQAAQAIAQQVSNRVQAKFAGAEVGDKNKVETYMENVVKSLADAKITGWKKADDFWAYVRYLKPDGSVDKQVYRFFTLYTIPKKALDKLVANQLDAANAADKPKNEEERTARERVREAFTDGLN